MLLRVDERVCAADVYDGDVVTHPVSGETVTVVTMMQLTPLVMISVRGRHEINPLDNDASNDLLNAVPVDELALDPEQVVHRQWRSAAPH